MSAIQEDSAVYILDDVLMIILALVSVFLLVLETTTNLTTEQVYLINNTDLAIASIFLVEFFVKLFLAESKKQFLKNNWWYLLASIPSTIPALRALRILRLLRLIRLTRLVTGTRAILDYVERFFKQTYIIYVIVIFALFVGAGAVSFDFFEYGTNPLVHGFLDSLWWAMGTVTTSGSGSVYPITLGGRITSMVLMLCGIGIAGTFTALVASFFVREHRKD
jgi:voltage-gated potassium channel